MASDIRVSNEAKACGDIHETIHFIMKPAQIVTWEVTRIAYRLVLPFERPTRDLVDENQWLSLD